MAEPCAAAGWGLTSRTVSVTSRFEPWTALGLEQDRSMHHVHDRTRPYQPAHERVGHVERVRRTDEFGDGSGG